jgi:energy-coupling factor transporter ATP-binding protein EcfA2
VFLICPGCGEWSNLRPVVESTIVCECGYRQPITLRPLLLVTGASGTGKSTIALQLIRLFTEAVVLDQDILWMPEMDTPEDNWARFGSLWLRVVANIAQSGRPVLLFGSADPDRYEALPERRYVGPIRTLALVCNDEELTLRLRTRPAWRNSAGEGFVSSMLHFNESLRSLAGLRRERVTLLDTSRDRVEASAAQVVKWAAPILENEQDLARLPL